MTPEHQALREAVAETLRLRAYGPNGPAVAFREAGEPHRREWLARADAVLLVVREALREPTEAMADAPPEFPSYWCERIWRAMLAASALGGPGHD